MAINSLVYILVLDRHTSELDRLDLSYTKIPGVEIQTYLPNLYFRKFRLIEKLNGMRHGFPTMENTETNANQPIVRPLTPWDKVLEDVASRVESMKEVMLGLVRSRSSR